MSDYFVNLLLFLKCYFFLQKEEISLRPDTSRRVGSGRILGRERERGDPRDNDEQGGGYDRDRWVSQS